MIIQERTQVLPWGNEVERKLNILKNMLFFKGSWHLHFWVIFKCKGCFDDCRDLHSRISVTEFSYKLCFLCMHELIPEPVTHIRSRKNYNNISNAKTGMFGLARKLITKCHNRLESTLYNRQGVGGVQGQVEGSGLW